MLAVIDLYGYPWSLDDGWAVTLPRYAFCEGGKTLEWCVQRVTHACLAPTLGPGLWGWACAKHARSYRRDCRLKLRPH